ncbi:GFA family protein [Sphingomonas sp. Leaf10]|uniref:GFA family protein n=1 Tax=Sphingomonas sp. Leaf10 TaxID=1735676 RepID=UPI001F269A8A|nr:GFA family protein [Sphingomonas sp. Leaf10]
MSGSAFSLNVAVPSAALTVVAGETVIGGLHGAQIRHHHCDHCKSWLFTRIEPDPGFANVRVGALDDPTPFAPFIETWTDEALSWATTRAPSLSAVPAARGVRTVAGRVCRKPKRLTRFHRTAPGDRKRRCVSCLPCCCWPLPRRHPPSPPPVPRPAMSGSGSTPRPGRSSSRSM